MPAIIHPNQLTFVLAPDSFKESMSAPEACAAMAAGIGQVFPAATCLSVPMADGGEGTMRALVTATGGQVYRQMVAGPLGFPVVAEYGILGDKQTGVVELASASGLQLMPPENRNPLITTTYGTGELIRALLSRGITKLVIGIGGSATNDGGVGLVQALGGKFLDHTGAEIERGGAALARIHTMDLTDLITRNLNLDVAVACDVTNPLTGQQGAARIYGPQKGATEEMVNQLDQALNHYSGKIREFTGKEVADIPGVGAAGGAGAGLLAFLNARLLRGVDLVMQHCGLEEKIKTAGFVLTGEGSLDRQTLQGKTIMGVLSLAHKYQKPVLAFAGRVSDKTELQDLGLAGLYTIVKPDVTLAQALAQGFQNLQRSVAQAMQELKEKMESGQANPGKM